MSLLIATYSAYRYLISALSTYLVSAVGVNAQLSRASVDADGAYSKDRALIFDSPQGPCVRHSTYKPFISALTKHFVSAVGVNVGMVTLANSVAQNGSTFEAAVVVVPLVSVAAASLVLFYSVALSRRNKD